MHIIVYQRCNEHNQFLQRFVSHYWKNIVLNVWKYNREAAFLFFLFLPAVRSITARWRLRVGLQGTPCTSITDKTLSNNIVLPDK